MCSQNSVDELQMSIEKLFCAILLKSAGMFLLNHTNSRIIYVDYSLPTYENTFGNTNQGSGCVYY